MLRIHLLPLALAALIPINGYAQPGERPDASDDDTDNAAMVQPRRSRPKASFGEIFATTSGIGIDLYRPPVVGAATVDKPWTNVNLLLYLLEMQVGFGKLDADFSKLENTNSLSTYVGTPGRDVYGRHVSVGANFPIAPNVLGFGNGRHGSLLRGHLFGAVTLGGFSLWEKNKDYKGGLTYLAVAPGVRVYNNFLSAELRMQASLGFRSGDGYEQYFRAGSLMPVLTVRANGLFSRLVLRERLVGSTSYSISDVQSRSSTDYINRPDGRYERTTTTTSANVSSSRGTSFLTDMGRYIGIGPRIGISRPLNEHYTGNTVLLGGHAQLRKSKLLLGLNAETGRVGHGSITRKSGDDKRRVDMNKTYGRGTLQTTNVFADLGLDISSLAKGLLLRSVDDENNATTFGSINVGYSLGASIIGDQRFEDPTASEAAYSAYFANGRERTVRNDPRLSRTGIVGGFFLGFDIGAVGFRIQGYRYKNAPLANGTVYTLCYRF